MLANLARTCAGGAAVSVKVRAPTALRLGRGEGIAAHAVVLLERDERRMNEDSKR